MPASNRPSDPSGEGSAGTFETDLLSYLEFLNSYTNANKARVGRRVRNYAMFNETPKLVAGCSRY